MVYNNVFLFSKFKSFFHKNLWNKISLSKYMVAKTALDKESEANSSCSSSKTNYLCDLGLDI